MVTPSSWMSCRAWSGSKRPSGMTSFTPAIIPTTRLLWQPETWNSGEVSRPTVWPPPLSSGGRLGVGHHRGDGVEHRVLEVGDHVAVGGDGALGPAGRARRVEDDGRVVLVDVVVGELVGGLAHELGEGVDAGVVVVGRIGVDQVDVLERRAAWSSWSAMRSNRLASATSTLAPLSSRP